MSTTSVTITSHGTPDDLYDTLARVFPETRSNASRWITLDVDGVTLTFFGSHITPEPEAALTDESYDLAETVS